jgi:hypothetical protein
LAKKKRGSDHPGNRITDLDSENPVARWHACDALRPGPDARPEVIERLLTLLNDPVDWDHGHYVALAAFEALTRLDSFGYLWLKRASEAVRLHSAEGRGDLAAGMILAARAVLPPAPFVQWLNDTVPTPNDADKHWLIQVVDWLPFDWFRDEELVRHLTTLPDPQDAEQAWLALRRLEQMYSKTLSEYPNQAGPLNEILEPIRYWTAQAPGHINR